MTKIKVGIVNYLNTRPLLYGLEHSPVINEIELYGDYPSNVAKALIEGNIDVGLVPVSVIPRLEEAHIITDYCIGCDGSVASVCIFSDVPIEQVKTVLLDYQSRTSVALARLLLKDYWQISPELVEASTDFRSHINGKAAGVVIGDRAFEQRKISQYVYDLGKAWKDYSGLPFVFAAWVSNKKLDPGFIQAFNDANKLGVDSIEELVATTNSDLFDLHEYYTKYIQYELDQPKKEALKLFLSRLNAVVAADS